MIRVGILALQGDFAKHAIKFSEHGALTRSIRNISELNGIDALVIPGGESTTVLKLLSAAFRSALYDKIASGLPVFATCAGLILLANNVINPAQESLQLLEATVIRNAYGSQRDSFIAPELSWEIQGAHDTQEGVFIRAPQIQAFKSGVTPVLSLNENIVCIQQGTILAASFHPELSAGKSPLIQYFIEHICSPTIDR